MEQALRSLAEETQFSGVVRVDRGGTTELAEAFGRAERGLGVDNGVHTQFGLASATKGLTALTVMSLVEAGVLATDTTIRQILGDDLPEVDDRVTVEHLLAHRSGIGDYINEDAGFEQTDYVLPLPIH